MIIYCLACFMYLKKMFSLFFDGVWRDCVFSQRSLSHWSDIAIDRGRDIIDWMRPYRSIQILAERLARSLKNSRGIAREMTRLVVDLLVLAVCVVQGQVYRIFFPSLNLEFLFSKFLSRFFKLVHLLLTDGPHLSTCSFLFVEPKGKGDDSNGLSFFRVRSCFI